MRNTLPLCAALALAAGPSLADVSYGIGFSYVFGGEYGVTAKVFSTDEPDEAAVSLGVDYMFGTGRVRPNIGAAYLDEDFWIDLNLGYNFFNQSIDYGIGAGGLGGMADEPPPIVTVVQSPE